jgi:hypothetical protein
MESAGILALLALLGPLGCGSGSSSSTTGGGPGPGPSGESVTLAWEEPSESEDGSALADLAGYKVYDGISSGSYTAVTDVGDATLFTSDPYPAGTYYFAVTAYDAWGNESDFSNEVVITIDDEDPMAMAALAGP